MIIPIVAIICIFGLPMSIPLFNLWTKHQRDMLQLRLQLQQGNGNVHTEIEALRQEIQALRETSMQYDLSFDSALQRMEQRVARVENTSSFSPTIRPEEAVLNLRNSG